MAAGLSGRPAAWAVADVTDRDAFGKAVTGLQEQLGPIDLLIANAGSASRRRPLTFSAEDVEARSAST